MKTELSQLQWQILQLWNPYGQNLKLPSIAKLLHLSYSEIRNEIDVLRKSVTFGSRIKTLLKLKKEIQKAKTPKIKSKIDKPLRFEPKFFEEREFCEGDNMIEFDEENVFDQIPIDQYEGGGNEEKQKYNSQSYDPFSPYIQQKWKEQGLNLTHEARKERPGPTDAKIKTSKRKSIRDIPTHGIEITLRKKNA